MAGMSWCNVVVSNFVVSFELFWSRGVGRHKFFGSEFLAKKVATKHLFRVHSSTCKNRMNSSALVGVVSPLNRHVRLQNETPPELGAGLCTRVF